MELGSKCRYHLVRSGDDYAVQYLGDDPDINFPSLLEGM
jgi:hypothetical protein